MAATPRWPRERGAWPSGRRGPHVRPTESVACTGTRRTLTPMAVHETRMLLLGAVAMFEPVNGYQIRRELVSWQVDRWANVNPGSIYHGLGTLTAEGFLARADLLDGTREVAVYEVTAAGPRPAPAIAADRPRDGGPL